MNKVIMNKVPILFTSKTCGACVQQIELLKKHFKDDNVKIMYIDVDKHDLPFIKFTPTWYIPNKSGTYSVYDTLITNPKDFNKLVIKAKKKVCKKVKKKVCKKSRFGDNLGSWARDGKKFPDNEGFQIPNSFMNDITDKWGKGDNALISGSLGRDQGPGNFNNVLSNENVNDIRMVRPNDPHGAALSLNRTCNQTSSVSNYPGMIYNAKNPQIVNQTGFGKCKFGYNLYSQMGPAYGSQYLMNKDTVKDLYGGGIADYERPTTVKSSTFIGQAKPYTPLTKLTFGKKVKMVKNVKKFKKFKKIKMVKMVKKGGKLTDKSINVKVIVKRKSHIGEGTILKVCKGTNKVKIKN